VRRRQWHREIRRDESGTHSPMASDAGSTGGRAVSTSSTGSANGRRKRMFEDKATA